MRFFKRGETADSKFVFLDSVTNEAVNVLNPTYRIVHYDGPTEIIDVAETTLDMISPARIGHYVVNWEIPTDIPEFETYFVYATGIHVSDNTTTQIEDFYRVIPTNFFGGGGGSNAGLTIKFTKP